MLDDDAAIDDGHIAQFRRQLIVVRTCSASAEVSRIARGLLPLRRLQVVDVGRPVYQRGTSNSVRSGPCFRRSNVDETGLDRDPAPASPQTDAQVVLRRHVETEAHDRVMRRARTLNMDEGAKNSLSSTGLDFVDCSVAASARGAWLRRAIAPGLGDAEGHFERLHGSTFTSVICSSRPPPRRLTFELEFDPLALAGLAQKFDKPGQIQPVAPLDAKEIAPRRQDIDVMIDAAVVLLAFDEQIDGKQTTRELALKDLERDPYALPPEVDGGLRLRRLGDLSDKEAAGRLAFDI